MDCKYPHIKVKIIGEDGNAFAIIGHVRRAMRNAMVEQKDIEAFTKEAMGGDYDNVLTTCLKWVDVE